MVLLVLLSYWKLSAWDLFRLAGTRVLVLYMRIGKLICKVMTIWRRVNHALDSRFSEKWLPYLAIASKWLLGQRTFSAYLELIYLSNISINVCKVDLCLLHWREWLFDIWIWSHLLVFLHSSKSYCISPIPILGSLIEISWFFVFLLESA